MQNFWEIVETVFIVLLEKEKLSFGHAHFSLLFLLAQNVFNFFSVIFRDHTTGLRNYWPPHKLYILVNFGIIIFFEIRKKTIHVILLFIQLRIYYNFSSFDAWCQPEKPICSIVLTKKHLLEWREWGNHLILLKQKNCENVVQGSAVYGEGRACAFTF